MVVLVDEEVELVRRRGHDAQHRADQRLRVLEVVELLVEVAELRDALAVAHQERPDAGPHGVDEGAPQRLLPPIGGHAGEVQGEDQVAALLRRRVLVDPEAAEERVPAVAPAEVVVVLQHAHQRGLAEAPRAEEDDVPVAGLEDGEERGLVRVEEAVAADPAEVADAVGDLHGAPPRHCGAPRRELPPGREQGETTPARGGLRPAFVP